MYQCELPAIEEHGRLELPQADKDSRQNYYSKH